MTAQPTPTKKETGRSPPFGGRTRLDALPRKVPKHGTRTTLMCLRSSASGAERDYGPHHGPASVRRDCSEHSTGWIVSYFVVVPAVVVSLGTGTGRGISVVPIRLPISSRTAIRSETAPSGTAKSMDAWYPSDSIFWYWAAGIAFLVLTSMPFNNSPSSV